LDNKVIITIEVSRTSVFDEYIDEYTHYVNHWSSDSNLKLMFLFTRTSFLFPIVYNFAMYNIIYMYKYIFNLFASLCELQRKILRAIWINRVDPTKLDAIGNTFQDPMLFSWSFYPFVFCIFFISRLSR